MSDKQTVIVKWKYSTKGMKDYLSYIKKQVEDRRNNEGNFAVQDNLEIGQKEHDDQVAYELSLRGSNGTERYLNYMANRPGSEVTFSDEGLNISTLEEECVNYEGTIWYPIVSVKEKTALFYQLTTEQDWINKGRELAEEYRKVLGINQDTFRWIAAFHTKPEADQNKNADAETMPHLHFMLWERNPVCADKNLTPAQLETIRTRTANVISRDFMKQYYATRNELRKDIKTHAMYSLDDLANDVKSLVYDTRNITGASGHMNLGTFEKRKNEAIKILTKLEDGKELTDSEKYFLETYKLESINDVRNLVSNYNYILVKLDELTDQIMQLDDMQNLYNQWWDISIAMRESQFTDLAEKNTNKDFTNIKRNIKNSILRECLKAQYNNYRISPQMKGMLSEKIGAGFYKNEVNVDQFKSTTKVITTLCKEAGISKEVCYKMQSELLERSRKEYWETIMKAEMEAIYNDLSYRFNVTTQDYWNALRSIQTQVPKKNVSILTNDIPPADIANSVILEPLRKTVLDETESNMSNSDSLEVSNFLHHKFSTDEIEPLDEEGYKTKYEYIYATFIEASRLESDALIKE